MCKLQSRLAITYNILHDVNVLQACLMLSLENDYPPTYQLALDMLKVYCSNTAAFPILILGNSHSV